MDDIIIIGGGIAGLYTAYKLSSKYPNKSIKLLEKNNSLGGRVFTYHDKTMDVETGAGRFHSKNKNLMKLLKELDLDKKKIKITTDFKVIDENDPGEIQESKNDEIIKKIIKNVNEKKEVLQNKTFMDYAKIKVSKEEIQYLHDFFGYTSELTEMNAYDAIDIIKEYFTGSIQYYIMNGGLSQIIDKLVSILKERDVQILKNREVIDIEHINNKFEITVKDKKTKYKSEVCVCATQKDFLQKLQIFEHIKKYLKYLVGKPLCRIYSKFSKDDIWFKDYPKLTMNNKMRYMIPINKEEGIIMISYTDNVYADYWKRLYEKEGIEGINKKHRQLIKKTFNIEISEPINTKLFYWSSGVVFLKPGYDSTTMPQKIMQPFEDKPLFVCGENYSAKNTAWMEGALDTSEYILKRI
jgi:monoamine oxidase